MRSLLKSAFLKDLCGSILCPGQDYDKKGHSLCNSLVFLTVGPTENGKIERERDLYIDKTAEKKIKTEL